MINISGHKTTQQSLAGKRIIVFFGSLELGGAERQGLLLARDLKERYGAHVEVWGFNGPGKSTRICEEIGIQWRIAPAPFTGNKIQRWIRLLRFLLLLKKIKPDVLLPYTMFPNVCCGIVWKWTRAKTCFWNQRDEGIERFLPNLERWAIRETPYFLSNSKKGAEFLIYSLNVNPDLVRIIPNGIELPPPMMGRNEWRKKLGLGDSFTACMIANFSKYKDHATLIRAWRIVLKESNGRINNPVLLLAGSFNNLEKPIKILVKQYGLQNLIYFLDRVEDISGLIYASDLGVLSSISEGCPNGILECMSAGLPVVATDTPGIRDAVGFDNIPFLAASGNEKELADKIIEMAVNKRLRESVGLKNKERVSKEFSTERMCNEMAEIISKKVG